MSKNQKTEKPEQNETAEANEKKLGKNEYRCVYGVRHKGKLHTGTVELDEETAAPLLKIGAITK